MNPGYALGILMIFQEQAKMGGQPGNLEKMQQFRNMINSCRFIDLGFNGPKFTWCNKIDPHVRIQESLDRSLANIEWITLYDEYKVQHLDLIGSDHRPILLDSAPNIKGNFNFRPCRLGTSLFQTLSKVLGQITKGVLPCIICAERCKFARRTS